MLSSAKGTAINDEGGGGAFSFIGEDILWVQPYDDAIHFAHLFYTVVIIFIYG